MYVLCLVLFVMSKILDSSELSCLLEMGVPGRILPGMYQRRTAVWEGRGATARPREAKWSSGVAANITKREIKRDISAIFVRNGMSWIAIFCHAQMSQIVTFFFFVRNVYMSDQIMYWYDTLSEGKISNTK